MWQDSRNLGAWWHGRAQPPTYPGSPAYPCTLRWERNDLLACLSHCILISVIAAQSVPLLMWRWKRYKNKRSWWGLNLRIPLSLQWWCYYFRVPSKCQELSLLLTYNTSFHLHQPCGVPLGFPLYSSGQRLSNSPKAHISLPPKQVFSMICCVSQ